FLSSVEGFELECGNVDEDIAAAESTRQPAIPFHVGSDLAESEPRGNVHRLDGLGAQRAVDVDGMSLLENGDCRGEIAIIYTGTRSRGALPGRIGRSRRRSNRNP